MAAPIKRIYAVFVTRIPWTVANQQLKEYFSQFGLVKRVTLPFNMETGFHKGFGSVYFVSEEGFQNTLLKDTHVMDGVEILVRKDNYMAQRKDNYMDQRKDGYMDQRKDGYMDQRKD